jgi:hypothetical protein
VNTGTWFVAGITKSGPVTPRTCTSFQQWQQIYGPRGTNPTTSDAVETYFAEGGSQVVTARVVGPAAAYATVVIPTTSLVVTAIGPGTYANGYKVVVTGTGPFTITIQDSNSNVLETSNSLASTADAVSYGQTSQYVTITASSSTLPTAGSYTLASGADDDASVSTTQYTAALALFTYDLGPGQVSCPGVTTSAVFTATAAHAAANNRIAYLDLPDSNVAATLTGDAAPVTALGTQARACALWTPWVDIQPATGGLGVRAVPPSAFAAGKAAAIDALGNPNLAPAGINGILRTPVQLHATFTDADRQTLNTAGINVIRKMPADFRIYGNVTAVNRITDPLYFQLSNVRLDMAIVAQGQAIAETYVFSQIDGLGLDAAKFGGELVNLLTRYQTIGALFTGTDGVAFTVDVGPDVNPLSSEAQGILVATVGTVRSPGAEQVNLNIVRVSVAQGL